MTGSNDRPDIKKYFTFVLNLKIKIQRDSKDERITFSHVTKNDVLDKNLDSES
jgi:hypothetical protein